MYGVKDIFIGMTSLLYLTKSTNWFKLLVGDTQTGDLISLPVQSRLRFTMCSMALHTPTSEANGPV